MGTKPSSINPSAIGVSENGKNHVISPNARCTEFLPTCYPQTSPSFVGKYTSTMEHMVMGITSLPPKKKCYKPMLGGCQTNTLVICYIAIEHGPVEIVDLPIKKW